MSFHLRLLFCCSIFLLQAHQSFAQSISRSAIGAAGQTLNIGGVVVQSIIGQSSLTYNRHGFIQPQQSQANTPERTMAISPNPTRAISYISGVVKGDQITIYDAQGNIVQSFYSTSFTKQPLNLESNPNGVYLIRVTGSSNYNSLRLIKTN
jgi:hypothetical protein